MTMQYAKVYSAQADVGNVIKITIEADISNGLHNFSIIGLTDKAIEEAKDRTGAAIKNSGLTSPKTQNQKTTISLAPADIKKEGPVFDMPIALSYLLASKQINFNASKKCFLGELALSGEVQKVRGVLPIARSAQALGFTSLYVPKENVHEAAVIDGIEVYGVSTLAELITHLDSNKVGHRECKLLPSKKIPLTHTTHSQIDISEIKGQESAKRALLVAAAGGHNIALYGPPGTGKTMLAKALRGILPPLCLDDAFEVASIHSVAGVLRDGVTTNAPFRSPHHTSSHVAIVGGGTNPRPGEITLAHRGVLFMDEFPEFEKRVLESLREPLEEGSISISRAKGRALFPADFILVAALNPCPCGNTGNPLKRCLCTQSDIERYTKKISGPIMDRIDMWVEVQHVPFEDLHNKSQNQNESAKFREKISLARDLQKNRAEISGGIGNNKSARFLNSSLSSKDIESSIALSDETKKVLQAAATKLALSPRAYYKVIKLARTIADLEGSLDVGTPHILEALQYRPKINN